MGNGRKNLKAKKQTQGAGRRPAGTNEKPRNADRAAWGGRSVAAFAAATGLRADLGSDPETVLGDLLADLMHWCDARAPSGRLTQFVDFESALKRARDHYGNETADEQRKARRCSRIMTQLSETRPVRPHGTPLRKSN